jgi:capsule polysaccharide export protein KpsE/RkpR
MSPGMRKRDPSWEAAYASIDQLQQQLQEEASAIAATSLSDLSGQAAAHHFLAEEAQYRVVPVQARIPLAATMFR